MYPFVIPLVVAIEQFVEGTCLLKRSTFLAMAQHRFEVALVITEVGATRPSPTTGAINPDCPRPDLCTGIAGHHGHGDSSRATT